MMTASAQNFTLKGRHVLAMLLLATAWTLLCRLHARAAPHVSAMVQQAARRSSAWLGKDIGPHPH